jgi:hypothetical protein
VTVCALAGGPSEATITPNAGHYSDWKTALDQNGTLFYVKLHIGTDAAGILQRFAPPQRLDIDTRFAHVLDERTTCVYPMSSLEHGRRQRPQKSATTDMLRTEPSAFFRPDGEDPHIAAGSSTLALQGCHTRKCGEYSCKPVKVAPLRNRIEMRSDNQRGSATDLARERHRKIEGRIDLDPEPQIASGLRDHVVSHLLALAIGRPGEPHTVK